MSQGPVIAIDGPAGSGKSTLARGLAARFGLPYINTGLMYRALTALALERGVAPTDGTALEGLLGDLRFDLDESLDPPELRIDGKEAGEWLTTADVEGAVSTVAGHRSVRRAMAARQRELGGRGAVMEGRDIGTVVFPGATLKVFLDASAEERVRRRGRERPSAPRVGEALVARDSRDARVNPLVPAPGAVRVDSTGRTAQEVLDHVAELLRARGVVGPSARSDT
jgi:cytidylate kinase